MHGCDCRPDRTRARVAYQASGIPVPLIGFFRQWLPWALSPRGTFVYHFMPAVPLGCMALAVVVADGWRRGGVWRLIAVGYVSAIITTFAYFYPVLTGQRIPLEQLDARLWLGSWR